MLRWVLEILVWVVAFAVAVSLVVLPKDHAVHERVSSLGGPAVVVPAVLVLALALSAFIWRSLTPVVTSNLDPLLRAIGDVERAGLRWMKALYAINRLPEHQRQGGMESPELKALQQGWDDAYFNLRGEQHVAGEERFRDALSALTGFISFQAVLQQPGAQEVGDNRRLALNDELRFVGELASRTAKTIREVKRLAGGK